MLLEPCISIPESDDSGSAIPCPGVRTVSTIDDTLELYVQETETTVAPVKINKWHEKFAKSRASGKTKE